MKLELEAKFLNISKEETIKALSTAGFTLIQPERLLRRQTFNFPYKTPHAKWGRVRDEGNTVTLTIKEVFDKSKIDGTKEIELKVDDFETASKFMIACGLELASYQENTRETWKLGDIVATIDTWPSLSPFIEIEGPSSNEIKYISSKLGFDFSKAVFGSVDLIYEHELQIPRDIFLTIKHITFENPPS